MKKIHRFAGFVLMLGPATSLCGCTAAQGKQAETLLTKIGCDLVEVLGGGEAVATLCKDIAADVETEIAKREAIAPKASLALDRELLGHQARPHRRRERLAKHWNGRDPAETVEAGVPLEATIAVLCRRAITGR